MTTILGLSGSLRRASYNTALLRAASALMPDNVTLSIKTIHGVPLYNEDDETATGIPPSVQDLKESIAAADGLLLVSPEYNHSIPGPLKNAIDWISRPGADIPRIFGGKPVAVIGASPGGFGTVLGQIAWLPVLSTLGTIPWFGGRLAVSHAHNVFDRSGDIADDVTKKDLKKFVEDFVRFVSSQRRK